MGDACFLIGLMIAPALAAIASIFGAARLFRAPPGREPSPLRLLASYLLLLPAFAIGTCYAAAFGRSGSEGIQAPQAACGLGCVLAAAMAVAYIRRVRNLPNHQREVAEAFDLPVGDDRGSFVTLVLAVCGALAAAGALTVLTA